jgi:predicted RNA binding protein YcfA (HicA-like mRNA interferase family)
MKFREIDKILKKDGWYVVNVKGSHYQYEHPTKDGKVTVPRHNTDFRLKTAKSILKQAGLE